MGWDIGIEQYFFSDQLTVGLTYFHNYFKDLIGIDANFQSFNIDEAITKGVEFFLSTNASKDINLRATYTYTNAKNTTENSPDFDKPLLRRPKIKISFLVNYSINTKTNINLELIYSGKREDKDFSFFPANRTILSSYTLVNLSAHHDIFDFLRLYQCH